MKEGWEIKKLGEIAYIGLGFTHTPEYVESGVPFLSVKDISSGEICWENVKFVSQEEYDSAPKGAKPQKGDIMFCRVGTMGKPVIVTTDTPFCTFVSLGYLHLLNNNISNIYIKYWMQSNAFDIQVKANVKGVAIKNLNTGWLKEFTLPIPPIAEQEKIVAELDCLSGIIEKKKQQLKEYDALAQSIFYEMFGDPVENNKSWETKSLGEIATISSGGTPSRKNSEYFTGNINWYSAGELNYLYLPDSVEKITEEAINNSAAKVFKANSLMVGMYDTAAFKLGILRKDSASNQACANVDLHSDNVVWMYYLLSLMKEEALKHRHGIRQKNLNVGFIKSFVVPLPPLALQQEFASKIEAIEKQKELIKKSIEEVETLFNSRMDEYFN